ncbi:HNH endonuclease [Bifidobacterium eulemuris]|uniref:HNH endonuclease n=2 Tax=Bifidobacterium eulemuris TaxID=1765219 RepID=A0A261G9Z0_9BIFI|nr:HNH endonuclease [Bifidobacterium eulemuris]OZG68224.1 HNH endonuclease [Bifidobacterium eulemuris]
MAVSKRLRFEILRRDNYTCKYCHRSDVELTIDHVVPQALGGLDEAENLVACCMECNSGKSSINPDEPLVSDVSESALKFRDLLRMTRSWVEADIENEGDYVSMVLDMWQSITAVDDTHCFVLPDNWKSTARYWFKIDVPESYIEYAFQIAREKSDNGRLPRYKVFRYAAGVVGNRMDEAMRLAQERM